MRLELKNCHLPIYSQMTRNLAQPLLALVVEKFNPRLSVKSFFPTP